MTTIQTDVDTTAGLDLNEAADAFLRKWTDAEKPSGTDEGDNSTSQASPETETEEDIENDTEAEDAEDQDDAEEASDDDQDESEAPTPTKAGDEAEVEITVDGETHKVTVKELKRLYGQEAALTRKSQEVAAKRKEIEETGARYTLGLEKMLQKAQERFAPYSKIDFILAAKQMDANDFAALRAEAQAAYEDYRFLSQEMDTHLKGLEAQRSTMMKEAAREAIKVLTDPKTGIPGWSNALYDEIRAYGVSQGLPEETVNTLVDPAAIKLIHKAMLHDRATKVATEKKSKATPKKVIKSTTTPAAPTRANDKMAALRKSGSTEAAAEALLARWAS